MGKVISGDAGGSLWFAGDPAALAESKLARLRELTMMK
jgi:hypothetical protein